MTSSPLFKYDVISDFRFVSTAKNDCDPIYMIPDHQCVRFSFISDWGFFTRLRMNPIRSALEFGITLCVNTHTPEHFVYRIHENDPA